MWRWISVIYHNHNLAHKLNLRCVEEIMIKRTIKIKNCGRTQILCP